MTAYTLFPAFVRVFYKTQYAPHVMTLPTLAWNAGAGQGTFNTHNASTIDADTMINDLIDELAADFYGALDTFNNYVIYSFEDDNPAPFPVAGNTLAVAGSGTVDDLQEDTQITLSWHTDIFNISKLVLLDAEPIGGNYRDVLSKGTSGPVFNVDAIWTDEANGWAARDGHRPNTFIKAKQKLNDKLHKTTT